ncbi:Rrf2 family transcriptional regulator [Arenibacter sp. GZD96]|uniref:RrF2 family transcriptional regulator n=1 Tax=Aurantibrevibacter litoralis TaxID=3106030 RepID=UPI002AFF8CEB|nr:Rrf2 family transcriptional regulator [Arenibacter sp. GZD-96]MEA1785025.1 Rrf2 family transcriptional regulator [Arenibacter sp. GZD-96]
MFSKACEYGIRASIYIAQQSLADAKVGLKEVAKAIDSPEAYTSKILQQLTRSQIINSEKGPTGGFMMDASQLRTTQLSAIVLVLDGDRIYKGCGLGLRACNAVLPCPMHKQFAAIREDLKTMLESTSIQSLAMELDEGLTFLKR